METISGLEYFKYGVKNGLADLIKWYFDILTVRRDNIKTEFVNVSDGKVICKGVNGEMFLLNSLNANGCVIDYKDKITIDNTLLPNVNGSLETTVGRVIVNYVLISSNFGDKIPFINESVKTGDIEKILAKALVDDKVEIKEYQNFINSCTFLSTLSRIVTVVATPTNIKAPDGLHKFKEDLKTKFNKEYGPEWVKDHVKVGMFMMELKKFDAEYLKKDPTYKKVLTSKVMDNGRSKMFLGFGLDSGMTGGGVYVDNSLEEGYPKDNEQLASIFDASKVASYSRGHETQSGGVVAKIMLRVSNSLKIVKGDCGSKVYYPFEVTEDNHKNLNGLYMLDKGKLVCIEETKPLIGSTIQIRTPIYCKSPGNSYCGVCAGKNLENRTTGLNLVLTNISATILTSALKKMHNSQINVGKFGMVDIIK